MFSTVHTDYLPFKAFIYSALLHFGILGLFIFIVPVHPEPHKPVFVFFGQILKRNELSVFTPEPNLTDTHILEAQIPFTNTYTRTPYNDRSVPKPSYSAISQGQSKHTPKVFESPIPGDKGREQTVEQTLPKLPAAPKYQPLRFHSK